MMNQGTLQEQAYEYLRQEIIANRFQDEVLYSEATVTEALQISRTPARGALQKLQSEGYIDIYPSRGFVLHNADKKELESLFQTMVAYETYACFHIGNSEKETELLKELEASVQRQQECLRTGAVRSFIQEDGRFHQLILSTAGNELFDTAYSTYRFKIRNYLYQSLSQNQAMERSVKEHKELIQAIRRGKDRVIADLLEKHHNDFAGGR